jgi:hypothetical protein
LPSRSPSSTRPKNSTRALYLTCGSADFPTTTPPNWLPGAKQFKIDLTVNGKDLEETVWRYLCIAKESGAAIAKNSLLAVKNDARLVRRQVYELFAGNCKPDDVLAAEKKEGKRGSFNSHLYY